MVYGVFRLHFWLIFFCPFILFGQEQITEFENQRIYSPNSPTFIDSVNGLAVFKNYFPELGYRYWSTDGTKEATKPIEHTGGGAELNYLQYHLRYKDYLFLGNTDGIWKTDGKSIEIFYDSSAVQNMVDFNGEPFVIFGEYNTRLGVGQFAFKKIGSEKGLLLWERNILSYEFRGDTLHYAQYDSLNNTVGIYQYAYGKKRFLLAQQVMGIFEYFGGFEYQKVNGTEFYILNFSNYPTLYAIKGEDVKEYDWRTGPHSENSLWIKLPNFFQGSENEYYFIRRYNDVANILKVTEEGTLEEPIQAYLHDIFFKPSDGDIFSLSTSVNLLFMNENKMVSLFARFPYLAVPTVCYFVEYDFKTGKKRYSKDLIKQIRFSPLRQNMKFKNLDGEVYEFDGGLGEIYTYSFALDSILTVEKYEYPRQSEVDSVILGGTKLWFSDNIYAVNDSEMEALVEQKPIWDWTGQFNFSRFDLDENHFVFQKPRLEGFGVEFWVSGGNKESTFILADFDTNGNISDRFYTFGKHLYFFLSGYNGDEKGVTLFKTDGTKEGTVEMFTVSIHYRYHQYGNQSQLAIDFDTPEKPNNFILVEQGKVHEYEIPESISDYSVSQSDYETFLILKTQTPTYGFHKLIRFFNGNQEVLEDELVYTNDDSFDYPISRNRLFYAKRENTADKYFNEIRYLENGEVKTLVKGRNILEFVVKGDYLVYREEYALNVIDLISLKEVYQVERFNQYSERDYSIRNTSNLLIINIKEKMIVVGKNGGKEFDFSNFAELDFKEVKGGFILVNAGVYQGNFVRIASFYDSAEGKFYTILRDDSITIETDINSDIALIGVYDGVLAEGSFMFWNLKEKAFSQVFYYSGDLRSTASLKKNTIVEEQSSLSGYDRYFWVFDGSTFNRKYDLSNSPVQFIGNSFFSLLDNSEKGLEIYELKADSLIAYPEIVKGSEGIVSLQSLFIFQNQLFAYAFTYSTGWQIWNLGEVKSQNSVEEVLANEPENEWLKIFPNPSSDLLKVEAKANLNYRIFNVSGQEFLQGQLSENREIDLRELPKGLYIIQFFDQEKSISKRILKVD